MSFLLQLESAASLPSQGLQALLTGLPVRGPDFADRALPGWREASCLPLPRPAASPKWLIIHKHSRRLQ